MTKQYDDIKRSQLTKPPTGESRKGLGCVLYVMVMLSLSLLSLKNLDKKKRLVDPVTGKRLRFGPEQVGYETALITSRVLLEFLHPSITKETSTHALKSYYDSLHKWSAHLTWQRVRKEDKYKQPKGDTVISNGKKILKEALGFVEECINMRKYRLTQVGGKYYGVFLDTYRTL